jgi:hypothetical protein
MLRAKLANNGVSGTDRIFRVVVMICLCVYWQRPAFSDEPPAAAEEKPHLQLAPILMRNSIDGAVSYQFQATKVGGAKTKHGQSFAIQANDRLSIKSFIWQPWLARVSGNLKVGVAKSFAKNDSSPTDSSLSTLYGGDAMLNVVRYSRFPFTARVFNENQRFESSYSAGTSDETRTGYSLNQSYTPRGGRFQAHASYDSSKSTSWSTIGPSYADVFNFSFRTAASRFNALTIDGTDNRQNQPASGQARMFEKVNIIHSYIPSMSFAVSTGLSASKTSSEETRGITPYQYDSDTWQFISFASLRPQRSPLSMTASLRFLKSDTSTNASSAATLKLSNFNLGANYLFSPLVRLYGSVNVTDSNGTQSVYTNTAFTAAKPFTYKSKTGVGGFRYTGSVGGTLYNNNVSTTDPTGQTTSNNQLGLKVYLAHALDKATAMAGGKLAQRLYQRITTGFVGGTSYLGNLTSGGSLTWDRVRGKETTMFGLNAADSRNLRGPMSSFQIVNLQLTRRQSMNSRESLQGSLTLQATHMQRNSLYRVSPSAELNYINQRTFGVRNLNFKSWLRISDSNIAPTQEYGNRASRSWENYLDYRVGLLTTGLTIRMTRTNYSSGSSINYYIIRRF